MRKLFFSLPILIPYLINAQTNLQKGEIAIKWDPTRLSNPFNSTIQVGAEFGITETLSIHSDLGINSNLYRDTYYNQKIIIVHNQLRKYKRYGHFYGLDLFYVFARDYSDSRCMHDKNKKINAYYDSVTLIKNAPGLAIISGRQMIMGNCIIDFFFGAGIRLVSNKLEYSTQTIRTGECPIPHFAWHNDKYSGTFPAGHFSCGIKLGYILNRKKQ